MNNNRATLAGKYEERKAYMSMHTTYIHMYISVHMTTGAVNSDCWKKSIQRLRFEESKLQI